MQYSRSVAAMQGVCMYIANRKSYGKFCTRGKSRVQYLKCMHTQYRIEYVMQVLLLIFHISFGTSCAFVHWCSDMIAEVSGIARDTAHADSVVAL